MKIKKIHISNIKRVNSHRLRKKFNNLPLHKKLYNSFILISFIGILSGLIGLAFLQKTASDYNYALENYGFSQGDIGKLGIEIEKSNSLVRDILFLSNPNEQKIAQKSLVSSLSNIDDLLKTVSTSTTTSEEKEILDRIKINLAKYKQIRDTVVSKGMANFRDDGLNVFRADGADLMNKISDDILLLLQTKINTCNALSIKLTIIKYISMVIVAFSIIVSLILSLFLSRYITKLISNPINAMKNAAKEMANGNLDVSIDISSNDEIGSLASSFSIMINTLKSYITEISAVLGNISSGNFDICIVEDYKGNFVEIKNSLDNIEQSLNDIFLEIKESTIQVNTGAIQVSSTSQIISE